MRCRAHICFWLSCCVVVSSGFKGGETTGKVSSWRVTLSAAEIHLNPFPAFMTSFDILARVLPIGLFDVT